MKLSKGFLTLCCLYVNFAVGISQDLSKHQWKDRLLIIMTNEISESFNQQMRLFRNDNNGLIERKVVVYSVTPKGYKIGLEKETIMSNPKSLKELKKTDSPFEMILIGLDGGVKKRFKEVTKPIEIFELIDSMPMRRSEMRTKGK